MSPRYRVLLAALILSAWMAATSIAAGHSVLERSDPPPDATVESPPRQVVLNVTEAVDPAFSSVTVVDRSGRGVSGRAAFSADRRRISVPLTELSRGVFIVRWRFLSGVDGHPSSGIFVFSVGQALTAGAAAGESAPDRLLLIVRWIGYLSAILLAGSELFQAMVLRPALRRMNADDAARIGAIAERRLQGLTRISALIFLADIATVVLLESATLLAAPVSQIIATGMLWVFLVGTKPGESAVLQTGVALVLLIPSQPRGWMRPVALIRPEPPILALILLAGFMLTSHAAGSGALAIVADWTHLLAVSLWIGGLASLLLVLRTTPPPDRGSLAQALVPRFSTMAGVGLGLVLLTGLYSAWLQVPAVRALTVTPYGRALLVKLLLVVSLAALGAVNRFVLVPRFRTTAGTRGVPIPSLLRSVSGEMILGAGVLLAATVLTATPPARVTLSAVSHKPLVLAGMAEDVRVRLTIDPARPGWNRVEADVTDRNGRLVGSDARVLVRLMKLDENLDPTTLTLAHQRRGRYATEGGELALPGWWQVEIVVRRRGSLDVSTAFPLLLGNPPAASDPGASHLLEQARAATVALRAWREVEQLTDGEGHVVITQYELQRPDRLRYVTSMGGEVMIIGPTRYMRRGLEPWTRESFPQINVADRILLYMKDAQNIVRGRTLQCEAEPCQVVFWRGLDGTASFAGWIGLNTHRVLKLLMAAPAHYMTAHPLDFNGAIRIMPPK